MTVAAKGSLAARCARGGFALTAGTAVERGARLARNMILARWFAEDVEQFGLMAIVNLASLLFEALSEVGVRQSIVQNRRGDTEAYLNVAWWLNAVRGVILCVLGFFAAPWIAAFYKTSGSPDLTPFLRLAFLSLLFSGLTSPGLYVLEKRMQFGKYVAATQGSGLAGTVVCLVLAGTVLPNVWALVIAYVAEAALRCFASFAVCPIRPRLPVDRESVRELFAFAKGMAGLPILTFFVMQVDVLVLGKAVDKDTLGLYSMVAMLANIPEMVFSRIAHPLVLPALSGLQDDLAAFRSALLGVTRELFTWGIPAAVCIAALSHPILWVVYTPPFAAMAPAFAIFCFYYLIYIPGTVIAAAYMALGRPGLHRRFVVIRAALLVIAIVPAVRWLGPPGAAAALLLSLGVATTFQVRNIGSAIGLRLREYLATGIRGLAFGLLALCPALAIRFLLDGLPAAQLALGAVLLLAVLAAAGWKSFGGAWRLAMGTISGGARS